MLSLSDASMLFCDSGVAVCVYEVAGVVGMIERIFGGGQEDVCLGGGLGMANKVGIASFFKSFLLPFVSLKQQTSKYFSHTTLLR